LADALHLLPDWSTAIDAVGVEFHSRRGRVEFMKIDLDLE
jgi:hypothetical protein